ncbi:MAG: carboxyl transferase [Lachnospiraceae bacterium]|nr:carboxyl transferase [Lachnospiraceae bacterium]
MSNAKLSARDRIYRLLDENSFVEIGSLVTKRNTDFNLASETAPSDGVITGYGTIDGSLVYVYSQDSSVLNGTIGEMHARKIASLYDLAVKVGSPVISLIDCAGLRLQEATDALAAFGDVFSSQVAASGIIPQISAVFGMCGGGSAVSASLADFTFMTDKNSSLFINSANTIDGNYKEKLDTGSAKFQAENGNVDFVCENEEDVLDGIRELISVLPLNNSECARFETEDDLNRATSAFEAEAVDPKVALTDISDDNLFIEVKKDYAKEMVTGFISLNGITVGAVANRVAVLGEDGKVAEKLDDKLTANGLRKACEFVNFCDSFNIPILTITNSTGFKADLCNEKRIAKEAASLTFAFANASVAKINLVCGNAFGSAYIIMNSKHIGADMVFAVESAKIGMMDSKVVANILCEKEEEKAAFAQNYDETHQTAVAAAKRGFVDSIISADSVRQNLCYAFDMLSTK